MSHRVVQLRAGPHEFTFAEGRPKLMGIVNTNPGSFSDATSLDSTEAQLARALQLVDAGADIIDVGFDSGVTYRDPDPVGVQAERGMPLVEALVARGVPVSVDTPVLEIAAACVEAGAAVVNDVSGLADPRMAELCAASGAALVVMHTRARHRERHFPAYDNVVEDVCAFLAEGVRTGREHGLAASQILLDPGLDYTKLPDETTQVIRSMERVAALGYPLLFGASNKYFAGVITGEPPPTRLPETLATVAALRRFGGFLRVHAVDEVRRFLDVAHVIDGTVPFPPYDLDDDKLKWVKR